MRHDLRLATLALTAALLARAAIAAAPADAPRLPEETRAVLAGGIDSLGRAHVAGAERASAPALLSRVPADVPAAALAARLRGTVGVRARISTLGLVDSVTAVSGDPRLRESALACVRWWIFTPPAAPVWTTQAVEIDGRDGADPLVPDLIAMERDALRRGAPWEAVDACAGELQRVGRHPRLLNEWAIRDRAIRYAHRAAGHLRVPGVLMADCQGARGQQFRTLASVDHADFVKKFDAALLVSPWWADGYQWRAASLLQCNRGIDAMRTLLLFRAAAADSAARALAGRALTRLAAGDSLGASQMLIREGVQFNRDEDADH